MNGILYLLIGGCVAGAITAAFFQKQDIGKISSTDAFVAVLFLAALASVACFLMYSRWGAKVRQKEADANDRVRINARTKGEVRTPPTS
jgi:branched-subunit amino acid ABC-type transport system permease component